MAKELKSLKEYESARMAFPNFRVFTGKLSKQREFINTWAKDIVLSCVGTDLFPSVVMAQACLETAYGDTIKKAANNLYGIKATGKWHGMVVSNTTFEEEDGRRVQYIGTGKIYRSYEDAIKSGAHYVTLFRAYSDPIESIKDHNRLFQTIRYDPVRAAKTPQEQCKMIEKCGYATASNYDETLAAVIKMYDLERLDVMLREIQK